MQFAQLLLVHRAGRIGHQALRALGLGEGDHVADGFGAGHQRDQAIQPERQAAMRWRAVLQGVEQEAEFLLRFFLADVERVEHLGLHFLLVDTHRAAADFPAVEHHVVGLGHCGTGVAGEQVFVAVLRCGEGMVQRGPAVVFFVVLEHGEIHHPQRRPGAAIEVVFFMADFRTQSAKRFVDHFGLVSTEEDDVAVLRAGAVDHRLQRGDVDVLDDGRLQAVFIELGNVVDLDVGQTLGAVDLDEFGVGVDLGAADCRAIRHAQGGYAATFHIGGAGEHLEIDIFHHVGDLGDFQRHAHVRLVGAVAIHRFSV